MKNLKSQKGAVTILVLITMLFMVSFLITTYIFISNKAQSQIEMTDQTKALYESESAEDIYYSYFGNTIQDDYVKEGLILWLDAINNTRNGHSNSTTVWEDLSGNNYDATFVGTNSNLTWGNDYVYINNFSNYFNTYKTWESIVNEETAITIEVLYDRTSASDALSGYNLNYRGLIGDHGQTVGFGLQELKTIHNNYPLGEYQNTIQITFKDGEECRILYYKNGIYNTEGITETSWEDRFSQNKNVFIGASIEGRSWNDKIHAVRIYNRRLTDEEIEKNYKIDRKRYLNEVIEENDSYNEAIPIYTVEQLLKIGSNENISINEVGGKIYIFSQYDNYILMNDLKFKASDWGNILGAGNNWIPVGNTSIGKNDKFEGNGHSITVTKLNNNEIVYNEDNKYKNQPQQYIEYIQSTGTQYIDTEVIGGNNVNIEIDFQIVQNLSTAAFVFGSRGVSSVNNMYGFAITGSSSGNKWTSLWNKQQFYKTGPRYDLNRHIIKVDGIIYYMDGTNLYTNNSATFSSLIPIYLFANNYIETANSFIPMKLFSCKMWDNGTLIRDFKPCIDQDGVACLYDIVTEEFFYNKGTGNFTVPTT